MAASKGHAEIVERLLVAGAVLNYQNKVDIKIAHVFITGSFILHFYASIVPKKAFLFKKKQLTELLVTLLLQTNNNRYSI